MPFGEAYNVYVAKPTDIWDVDFVTVNPGVWEKGVEAQLRKIEGTNAGRAVLDTIKETGWWVRVAPHARHISCNAHGFGGMGAIASGPGDPRKYGGAVVYDPAVYTAGSHCFRIKSGKGHKNGGRPDEVLYHELIHALRGGLGLNDPKPLSGGLFRYGNEEEFFAVVITNVYISDNTNASSSGLRKGHHGKAPLEERLARSLCFFYSSPKVLPLLTMIKDKQKKFFDRLADVDAVFNPFQAMRDVPKAVEAVSKSSRTLNYDRSAERTQKAELAAYLAELRKAYKDQKLKDQKATEDLLKSIFNASPQEAAQRMGSLGREAFDFIVGK